MKKNIMIQAAALMACTVAVAGFSIGAGRFSGEKNTVLAETETEDTVSAGVAQLISPAEDIRPVSVQAGLSARVGDYIQPVSITELERQQVAAAEQKKAEEKKTGESPKEETVCGYKRLGIAGVDDTLNVRKKNTTDSDIVGKMTKHAACEIKKTKDGWTKIESGKVNGWVKSEYLLTGDEALKVAKKEIITVAKIKTDSLRVRKQPSTDAPILSLVGMDEKFTVLKKKDGWVKIEVDDEKGYISTDFVDLSETLKTAQSMKELKKGQDKEVSDAAVDMISYALQFVGNPYVWGGESLTNGCDCSGFTMKIYQKYGVYLPHSSRAQPGCGRRVSSSEAKPGDLFFYGSGSSINHVAIYIGNGQIVHASNHRDGIKISNAFYRTPITVSRYL